MIRSHSAIYLVLGGTKSKSTAMCPRRIAFHILQLPVLTGSLRKKEKHDHSESNSLLLQLGPLLSCLRSPPLRSSSSVHVLNSR